MISLSCDHPLQDLESELEKLRQISNGPQTENGVPPEEGEKRPVVSMEVHEELLRSKEEEAEKARAEKEEVSQQLKQLEGKLDELKTKNNVSFVKF